jgi:N-acetylmuramoyl-L-alanine amidase
LPENPLQIHSPAVQHVKVIDSFGSTQIILRLGDEFLRYTHQLLEDPVRLVIDVYNARETLVEAQTPDDIVEETLPTDTEPMTPTLPKRSPLLRTVVIDPGHGGSDPGITVASGDAEQPALLEKDVTLQLANLLKTSLIRRLGVRVILTREGDDFVSSEHRTTIANSNRADVFLSLHVNNTLSAAVSGFEVYIMDYGSLELPEGYEALSAQSQVLDYAQAKYIDQSTALAEDIITAYQSRDGGRSSVVKRAPLFTLKGATMPAVHVEVGYSSNDRDHQLLLQEEFHQVLIAAMTDGLAAFQKERE